MKGGPSYCFEAEPRKILAHKAPSTRALGTRAPAADFWQHGRYTAATVKRRDAPMADNADGEAVECTQNHECRAHIAVSSALPLPRRTCKVSSALPRRRRGRDSQRGAANWPLIEPTSESWGR